MRAIFGVVLVLIAVQGCDDDVDVSVDAGIVADSRVADDGALVDCVNAPWSGTYQVSWQCTEGCEGGAPFDNYHHAQLADAEMRFQRDGCTTCDAVDTIAATGANCITGSGIPFGDGTSTDSYEICATSCSSATAEVNWSGYPGLNVDHSWTMTLTR